MFRVGMKVINGHGEVGTVICILKSHRTYPVRVDIGGSTVPDGIGYTENGIYNTLWPNAKDNIRPLTSLEEFLHGIY